MTRLRIGTRGSALALAQTRQTIARLQAAHPELEIEEVIIKTTGDRLAQVATPDLPMGKGVFTAELENALLDGTIDVAVHSLKDLPTQFARGLALGAVPVRANPMDVLLVKDSAITSLATMPEGAMVATGSQRRQKQLALQRPDLCFSDIRGNIDTRLQKLRDHAEWHGLVLAAAGLERLKPNVAGLHLVELTDTDMLPAPGQGALALQTRDPDAPTQALLLAIHHEETMACATAERAFLHALGGGCEWPLGALARWSANRLSLRGIYWKADETAPRMGDVAGDTSGRGDAQDLGARLARQLS